MNHKNKKLYPEKTTRIRNGRHEETTVYKKPEVYINKKPVTRSDLQQKIYVERHQVNYNGFIRSGAKTGYDDPWNREYLHKQNIQTSKVNGVTFNNNLQNKDFEPGKKIVLVPDPSNEYDANAIGIWNETITCQIGWIPKELAAELQLQETQKGYILSSWKNSKTNKKEGIEVCWSDTPFVLVVKK